jgi:hypothetical protein
MNLPKIFWQSLLYRAVSRICSCHRSSSLSFQGTTTSPGLVAIRYKNCLYSFSTASKSVRKFHHHRFLDFNLALIDSKSSCSIFRQISKLIFYLKRSRWESNPQRANLEFAALPIELREHFPREQSGLIVHF